MSSVLRKGRLPFCEKSLKRNQELRELIRHLKAVPNQTIMQVAAHTGWSQPKSRSAVETLRSYGLIHVSERTQSIFRTAINFYSVLDHDDSDLDTHLPITRPDGMPISGPRPVQASKTKPEVIVKRDPMVELLMGSRSAPSLNFINSRKESQDAQSKTTGATH